METKISEAMLHRIADTAVQFPEGFTPHPRVKTVLDRRVEMSRQGGIDWAFGELLALGSIAMEGRLVRMSGQDTRRGTFVQRHSVLIDHKTGAEFLPLQHLSDDQARVLIYDSALSEYAALGFEYGYSVANREALVLWEAQFGDFVNGAQSVIDEYLSSGEAKWGQQSGVVLLLPHAHEGQGPDHTSGRIERFLQLCAEGSMTVAVPSTPANYFHLLRRHVLDGVHRPMVVFTPKSMLRNKAAVSSVADFTAGKFESVIADHDGRRRRGPDRAAHQRQALLRAGQLPQGAQHHRRRDRPARADLPGPAPQALPRAGGLPRRRRFPLGAGGTGQPGFLDVPGAGVAGDDPQAARHQAGVPARDGGAVGRVRAGARGGAGSGHHRRVRALSRAHQPAGLRAGRVRYGHARCRGALSGRAGADGAGSRAAQPVSGEASGAPPGRWPDAVISGAVASTMRPVAMFAKCSAISCWVARPAATSMSLTCSTVARSSTAHAGPVIGKYASATTPCKPASRNRRGSVRPNRRSAPRSASSVRNPRRSRLPSTSAGPDSSGAQQRLQGGVGVFQHQPAAGSQRSDHGGHGRIPLRNMGEHEPRMDQVEGARRLVHGDVMTQHLEPLATGQPTGVDVRRHDAAGRADPVGQPRRQVRPARADLPAVPARPQPGGRQVTSGPGIEQLGQCPEPDPGLGARVVQQVPLVGHLSIVPGHRPARRTACPAAVRCSGTRGAGAPVRY